MFRDREDAGMQLAERLEQYKGRTGVIVLALPRGGIVPAFAIACRLKVPLDVLIVRKMGLPDDPELAIGAVSETGAVVLNTRIISTFGVPEDYIQAEVARQKAEIARRLELYRGGRGMTGLEGKIVILVDDGVATGATMKAAVTALKKEEISRLVVALPVAPPETMHALLRMTDELICLEAPENFMSVGSFYDDFTQVPDEEVVRMLRESEVSCRQQDG